MIYVAVQPVSSYRIYVIILYATEFYNSPLRTEAKMVE